VSSERSLEIFGAVAAGFAGFCKSSVDDLELRVLCGPLESEIVFSESPWVMRLADMPQRNPIQEIAAMRRMGLGFISMRIPKVICREHLHDEKTRGLGIMRQWESRYRLGSGEIETRSCGGRGDFRGGICPNFGTVWIARRCFTTDYADYSDLPNQEFHQDGLRTGRQETTETLRTTEFTEKNQFTSEDESFRNSLNSELLPPAMSA
jgi:hypothetical protein